MKADGGRIGYKDGPSLLDIIDVQASGSKTGKQQIEGAPEGITSDKETINAILTMDIPLTEKVNLIGDLRYGKFRDKIEYNDDEIFLEDPKSYRDRNIGLDYNRGGEGFSGSATVGDRGPAFNIRYKKSFADGGMLVQPSDDGSRPGYKEDKKIKRGNPYFASKEFIDKRDQGKDVPKVREYLNKLLRKKDNVVFKNIKDIMKKAGLPETSKVDADVSRLLTGEFKDIVQTEGQLQKTQYGNNAEKFRKILRDIQKTIPKGKKQFINIAFTARKNNLSGNPNSGSYSRVLQEPEFKNFVVLTKDVQSNPQIIRFAEEFEKLYEIKDIDKDFFRDLAKNVYGDDKPGSIKKITADASKYAEFLYGVRDVTDADGRKLKMPNIEKRGDYLFELIDETVALQEGEKGKVRPLTFGAGIERDRMLAVRDGLLGLKEGQTEAQRVNIRKLLKKGYNLDEVAGIAATHEIAPGYTELVQGLKKKVNADKMVKIDKPFSRIFEQVITGQKPTKGFQYGKEFYQDINEVVKLYNKDAAAYGKKYNIDVPLIEYDPRPGKKVNPKNFLPNFKYLSPAAQANVTELANRGIGVRTDAFTMNQLENRDLASDTKTQAKLLRKMGFKCKFAGKKGGLGSCDDPASYIDDINKTKADVNSNDPTVRNKAIVKNRKALEIAKTIPKIGKLVQKAAQVGASIITTPLKALGLTSPVGIAIEGAIEGGIYDYYRAQGYNHDQAYAETFTPKAATDALGITDTGVGYFEGAQKLLDAEKFGAVQYDMDGNEIGIKTGNPEGLAKQYDNLYKNYEQEYNKYTNIANSLDQIKSYGGPDLNDLEQQLKIQAVKVNQAADAIKPGTPAYEAFQIAEENQAGRMDNRRREYLEKTRDISEPSEDKIIKKDKQRDKAMLEMFPMYTPEVIDSMYQQANIEKPENFSIDAFNNVMRDQDKMNYFAENFRLEKASGGIASLTKTIPPESGPTPHGLPYVYNNVKKI
jgi:hypothetical protein